MDFRSIGRIISSEQVPEIILEDGIIIKVISGHLANVKGPVGEDSTNMEYLDVTLPPHTHWQHRIPKDHTGFLQVLSGSVTTGNAKLKTKELGIYSPGHHVEYISGSESVHFLLISCRALG